MRLGWQQQQKQQHWARNRDSSSRGDSSRGDSSKTDSSKADSSREGEKNRDKTEGTAADRLEAVADGLEAAADRLEAAADRLEAVADRLGAAADRLETAADRLEAAADRLEAVADRFETTPGWRPGGRTAAVGEQSHAPKVESLQRVTIKQRPPVHASFQNHSVALSPCLCVWCV